MKRRSIRWSESASLDLIEIFEFIRQDQPEAANRLTREIDAAVSSLRRQPKLGKIVPEFHEQGILDYRQLIVSSYRVIYSIRDPRIHILAVVDCRRDVEAALFLRLLR